MAQAESTAPVFRILALSGGGVRGLFQAKYLEKLEEHLGAPIHRHFDLIAGTSTGAINALVIASGSSPKVLVNLYRHHAPIIFSPRFLTGIREGPRYDNAKLREPLNEILGAMTLGDIETRILITATSVESFSSKVFSTLPGCGVVDSKLAAVDVALASAAAPTYFDPVSPTGDARSFVDGGLWANSPATVAVIYAHLFAQVPYDQMRLLTIGTGDFPEGSLRDHLIKLRPVSINAVQTIFEMMFASQVSFADECAVKLLGPNNVIRISCDLGAPIPLDDVNRALSELPPHADEQADTTAPAVKALLKSPVAEEVPQFQQADTAIKPVDPNEFAEASGLTAFYPSREYYKIWREECSSIDKYVSLAEHSLIMVSVNLMTGVPYDGLCDVIATKMKDAHDKYTVTLSLLNPGESDLMSVMARALDTTPETLAQNIRERLDMLKKFRDGLAANAKKRFDIRVHNSIPFGSGILIDHLTDKGRIQIETKPHRVPLSKSLGFEVTPGAPSGLYETLARSYDALLQEGNSIVN
ncbi:MAG TPA: CBASS cGAMP-activated phospholipase [Acidobacteriota bacterium]|nr:CBASS cGAMP-activated phospholipase [Acidobacteriota bacterium]